VIYPLRSLASCRRIAIVSVALVTFVASAFAQEQLREIGALSISRALDGDTVELSRGGQARLAGITAPKKRDAGADAGLADLADQARNALDRLSAGATARAFADEVSEDRHGRLLVYLRGADGAWVAEALLAAGLARVFTQPGVAARARAMLAAEAAARTARRGLWAFPQFRVLRANEAGRRLDRFQIVEGRLRGTARVRDLLYLNFGEDWRTDFTVGIDRVALASFRRSGLGPERWRGKTLRVRGWLLWRNGPFIAATHPEQIEVLD
jgi:endonuclease YncB( thermonuclease family)